MRTKTSGLTLSVLCSALISANAFAAQTASGHDSDVAGKPNPLNNLYFGEQHLHTSASVDAFIMGNRKNDIEDAFNYNKGKPVKKWITGETLQRKRAYDWTVVTDHSDSVLSVVRFLIIRQTVKMARHNQTRINRIEVVT